MARPRSDIAPRLLRAARARFLHEGVDGASLRDIARAAGTSLGMVNYYFSTKEELFLAVVEETYSAFARDVEEIMSAPGSLEERVRSLYGRLANMSDDDFDIIRLILREAMVSSERRALILARFLRGHVPPMFAAIFAAHAQKEIDPRLPIGAVGISIFCLALFPQLFRRLVGEKAPLPLPPAEELAKVLADIVFKGIRPEALVNDPGPVR